MSLHSRPLATQTTPERIASDPVTPASVMPETNATPHSRGAPPRDPESQSGRERTPGSRAAPSAAEATTWPWYRSEPWLVAVLAGFVPMLAAILAPESAKYPLIGLGALAALVGVAMLVRQGLFQPHARPDARGESTRQAAGARPSARGHDRDAGGAACPDPDRDSAELVR
jgi:hypothetical protein